MPESDQCYLSVWQTANPQIVYVASVLMQLRAQNLPQKWQMPKWQTPSALPLPEGPSLKALSRTLTLCVSHSHDAQSLPLWRHQ